MRTRDVEENERPRCNQLGHVNALLDQNMSVFCDDQEDYSKRTDFASTAFHLAKFPLTETTRHFALVDFPAALKCAVRLLYRMKSAGEASSSVTSRTWPRGGRVGIDESDMSEDRSCPKMKDGNLKEAGRLKLCAGRHKDDGISREDGGLRLQSFKFKLGSASWSVSSTR